MCYLFCHLCKYCGNEYECKEKNYICPSINADADAFMCPSCREIEKENFKKLLEELGK